MNRILKIIAFILVMSSSYSSSAAPAEGFTIAVNDGTDIDIDKDHYFVTLVKGWVSEKDSFFKSLIAKKSKLITMYDVEASFFDGDTLKISSLVENKNLKRKTNIPWGQNVTLFTTMPADAAVRIKFKASVHREDRINQMLESAKSSAPPGTADIFNSTWIGYSSLLTGLIGSFFGVLDESYPFHWVGDIKRASVITNNKIKEHYIIIISPNSNKDEFVENLDKSLLSYNPTTHQVIYDGNIVTKRSYVVLKVQITKRPNLRQLLYESDAPWAVLAANSFMVIDTVSANDSAGLTALSRAVEAQLSNELRLLKREHRFSKYDRATVLRAFAKKAKSEIERRCKDLNLPAGNCPVSNLRQFISSIDDAFPMSAANTALSNADANLIINEELKTFNPYIIIKNSFR